MSALRWHNPPPRWQHHDDRLSVHTGPQSDFWRETHYGFVRDSGHLYYQEAAGDFSAEVCFSGDYQTLYDQAGLMLRVDERNWVKAGVEYTDGLQHLSAVVTRDFSDWSVLPLPHAPDEVWLRLTRQGGAVLVQYSPDGQNWRMMRLAHLEAAPTVWVGMMCCSPERAGFKAHFKNFRVTEPLVKGLHQ